MSLTPGTRLGVYELGAQIGAGGMGEVYRAIDTRLDRTVAIKTIAVAFLVMEHAEGTSPKDGKAFAYISNETGTYEVFVMPLPKSGGKFQVTSGAGLLPQWINGGRELAYVTAEHR